MLIPMRNPCSLKKAAQVSSSSVPLVWNVFRKVIPGRRCFSSSSDDPAEEVESHQQGFSALPGHRDLPPAVGFDELADVALQRLVAHPEAAGPG